MDYSSTSSHQAGRVSLLPEIQKQLVSNGITGEFASEGKTINGQVKRNNILSYFILTCTIVCQFYLPKKFIKILLINRYYITYEIYTSMRENGNTTEDLMWNG